MIKETEEEMMTKRSPLQGSLLQKDLQTRGKGRNGVEIPMKTVMKKTKRVEGEEGIQPLTLIPMMMTINKS